MIGPYVIKNRVLFCYKPRTKARHICIVGDFNKWQAYRWRSRMRNRSKNGIWKKAIKLKPGSYRYKYIVDGKWINKYPSGWPVVDDGYGGHCLIFRYEKSSRIWKKQELKFLFKKKQTKKVLPKKIVIKKQQPRKRLSKLEPIINGTEVTFFFKPRGSVSKVYLAGNFNAWKPDHPEYAFKEQKLLGIWKLKVSLDPGRYQYKIVLDGQWTTDPNAPEFTPDGFGGRNGIIVVK